MPDKKPFDRSDYYKDMDDKVAEASGGRGSRSRVTKPLLEEQAARKKERPREQTPATFRIGQDLKDRVNEATENHNVEKASFVKALLTYALDELEAGSWELPPPTGKRKLKI